MIARSGGRMPFTEDIFILKNILATTSKQLLTSLSMARGTKLNRLFHKPCWTRIPVIGLHVISCSMSGLFPSLVRSFIVTLLPFIATFSSFSPWLNLSRNKIKFIDIFSRKENNYRADILKQVSSIRTGLYQRSYEPSWENNYSRSLTQGSNSCTIHQHWNSTK